MLNVFIDTLKEKFAPYVVAATEIILPLCVGSKMQQIKDEAIKCLPCLLVCVKNDKLQSSKLVKIFIEKLYHQADFEFEADLIDQNITIMKECIDTIGEPFLNQEEFNQLSQNIINLLMAQDKRKQELQQKHDDEEELDETEKQLMEIDTYDEENLTVTIAELIGTLFKTHRLQCGELALYVYSQFLPVSLKGDSRDQMKKFGLFLVDDMIEFLKYDLCADKWVQLAEYLVQNSSSTVCYIRQAACYGIGIFCQNTPKEAFTPFGTPIFQALCNASAVSKQPNDKSQ